MHKLLVIGLDGATLDLVLPWARAGYLPTMKRLIDTGAYAPLASVYPVLSSAAWASFMTGVNPGAHGTFDFVAREANSYRLRVVQRQHMHGASLWKILSEQGRRVVVVNVPMTYPAEPVNGVLVTGLGTPLHKPFTYPATLQKELAVKGYQVDKEVAFSPERAGTFLQAVYDHGEAQVSVTLDLMRQTSWDFFMYVFRDTDEMAHFFWGAMDDSHPQYHAAWAGEYRHALRNYYRYVDGKVGELIAAAGPDTNVVVMSDHGTGPLYKDVYLNEWLRQAGYLATRPPLAHRRLLSGLGLTRARVSALLRIGGMSWLETWLKERLGEKINLLPRDRHPEFGEAVDWSRTRAYSFGYHGQIYLNVQQREPQGPVMPGSDYNATRKGIVEQLLAWRDPADGLPVVSQVFMCEDLFRGEHLEKAPDIVVVMRDFSYITRQGYEFGAAPGALFSAPSTYETGSHRLQGLLMAAGPDIQPAGAIPPASILDLMPTLLTLLDCELPSYLEGRLVEPMFGAGWLDQHPVRYFEARLPAPGSDEPVDMSDEDEAKVVERLKDLGYLS